MDKQLNFLYDKEADVLYVALGKPEYTDYVEVGENLILRLDPESREVVGFTVIDFLTQSGKHDLPLRLPLQATLARTTRRMPKVRVAAEKQSSYRTRRVTTTGRKPLKRDL